MPKRESILISVEPRGRVTRAEEPIRVLVTLRYALGLSPVHDWPAEAIAWTRGEVLIRWDAVEVWVLAGDIRRA